MDAISSAISAITKPGIGDIAKLGTGVMGTIGNLITGMRGNTISANAAKQQQLLMEIAKNPAMLTALAKQIQVPLSTGLLENVGNNVQAILGERGLGSSPAQATAITSEAIAPWQQKSQEDAYNYILQTLGLTNQTTATAHGALPPQADTSAFWKMFQPKDETPNTGLVYGPPTPDQINSQYPFDPANLDLGSAGVNGQNAPWGLTTQ